MKHLCSTTKRHSVTGMSNCQSPLQGLENCLSLATQTSQSMTVSTSESVRSANLGKPTTLANYSVLRSIPAVALLLGLTSLFTACRPETPLTGCDAFFVEGAAPQGKKLRKICHKKMTIGFDERTLTAGYVAERLTRAQVNGAADRDHLGFRMDPLLPDHLQVSTRLYTRSGYDRGHLAAAANFKNDPEAMKESFYTSNVAPQNPELNRGIWSSLENTTRNCVEAVGQAYILTGVIHPANRKYLRRDKIKLSIPNAFWKLVVSGKNYRAFMMPNEAPNSETFTTFEVSLTELEAMTKLDLVPELKLGSNSKRNTGTLCAAQFGLSRGG